MITQCQTESDSATRPYQAEDEPGRNEPCPCGSGRKFKECCLPQLKAWRDRQTAPPWPAAQAEEFEYTNHGNRTVRANFSAGMITSDGGVMMWRELEEKFGIIEEIAECFEDYRDASLVEFELEELLAQRIFGLLEGYEDLNDHDDLRGDQAIGAAIGREDPTGMDRRRDQDKRKPGAGKSTLNRVELGTEEGSPVDRYKKIVPDVEALRDRLTDLSVQLIEELSEQQPERVIIDLDPSDVLLHGEQEGRYYHGHYGDYCYLPLYAFIGHWPLEVLLCRSSDNPARYADETLDRLVGTIREVWGECTVVVRGDGDFSRVPELMDWVEGQPGVEYVFGLKRNTRLERRAAEPMEEARRVSQSTGEAARRYTSFRYKTTTGTWSRKRRVVAKAEFLPGDGQHEAKRNTRFVVTSIDADEMADPAVYEDGYCPRGEAENALFAQQQLFSNRASTRYESSNQLRMLWSAIAGLFVLVLRRTALQGSSLEEAQIETIRDRLLKVSAQVEVTTRHIWFRYSSHFPHQHLLALVVKRIRAGPGR